MQNRNRKGYLIQYLSRFFALLVAAFLSIVVSGVVGGADSAAAAKEYAAEQAGIKIEYLHQSGQAIPGELARITMSFKNTGTATWTKKNKKSVCQFGEVCLGTAEPNDRSSILGDAKPNNLALEWINDRRPAKMTQQNVKPGQVATFTFYARVPEIYRSGGMGQEFFAPVVEGVTWIEVAQFSKAPVRMDVVSSYGYSVESIKVGDEYITNGGSINTVGGQSVPVEVKLKNTGTGNWKRGDENSWVGSTRIALSDARPSSEFAASDWYAPSRPAIMEEELIKTGQIGTFKFSMSLPTRQGNFFEKFRLIIEGMEWVESSPTIGIGFITENAKYSYDIIDVTPLPTKMEAGEPYSVKVKLRNTGNATWNRSDPSNPSIVLSKIGTSNPYDRESQFYTEGEWESMTRAATLNEKRVFPGQVGTFEFTVVAPFAGGKFVEYFNPIVEYLTWMQGDAIKIQTTVEQPKFDFTYMGQYTEVTDDPRFPMKPGERKEHWVRLRNDSNFTWRKYEGTRGNIHWASSCSMHIQQDDAYNRSVCGDFLAGKAHPDRKSIFHDPVTWVSDDRLSTFVQESVKPGEVAEFRYTVQAPNTPIGNRREYYRLVTELVAWFPDIGYYFEPVVSGSEAPQQKIYSTTQELNINGKTIKVPDRVGKVGIEQHLPVNEAELDRLREAANIYAQWKSAQSQGDLGRASQLESQWRNTLTSIENDHYNRSGTSISSRNGFAGASYGSAAGGAFFPPANPEMEKYYVNMRWPFVGWKWDGSVDTSDKAKLSTMRSYKGVKLLVTNRRTGKSVVAAIAESGPAPWTGTCYTKTGDKQNRVCPNASDSSFGNLKQFGIDSRSDFYNPGQIPVVDNNNDGIEDQSAFQNGIRAPRVAGLSPEAFEAIGANLDDIIEVGFLVDQSLPLGPVQN
jgi:hypothetical protein